MPLSTRKSAEWDSTYADEGVPRLDAPHSVSRGAPDTQERLGQPD